MDPESLKGQLINSYLNQQLSAPSHSEEGGSYDEEKAMQAIELPNNAILEEFKNQVRLWIEVDNQIHKLQHALRERNTLKKSLTEKILRFMGKYNIEDLNAKDGSKLRYKVSHVKPTVSKAEIKKRLMENYGKVQNIEELTELIFKSQGKVERVSLRRLRNGASIGLSGGEQDAS